MPKARFHRFVTVVEGHGTFPVDMLRYDQCAPASGADASAIEDWPGRAERRAVRLHRYSADPKSSPGVERWASFHWIVVSDEPEVR